MKLQVLITKEILKESRHCGSSPSKCAITQAVKELFPNAYTINGHIVTGLGINVGIKLPYEAFKWYQAWDRMTAKMRLTLPEFSFEIDDVPEKIIEAVGHERFIDIVSKSKTLKIV